MRARNLFSKVLSFALVAVMLLGMLPVFASAAESTVDGTKVKDGMYMNKYTVLEDDGTYTITLEAFATGTTTTSTVTQAVPMDIVVIVDQSGSMSGDLNNLKTAVTGFIDNIRENGVENDVNHRIAIVGFASSNTSYNDGQYENTELFIGSKQYNYGSTGRYNQSTESTLADTVYGIALQDVTDSTGYNNLIASKNALTASGGTYPVYGFNMANGIFKAYEDNNQHTYTTEAGTTEIRPRVIVFFTDGEPGTGNGVNTTAANNAISAANTSKNTYDATVYAVGLFSSAGNDVTKFMNLVSSNCPDAQSMTNPSLTVGNVYVGTYEISTSSTYYYQNGSNYARAYYCATCRAWRTAQCNGWISHNAGGEVLTPKTSATSEGTQFYKQTMAATNLATTKYYMTTDNSAELENIFSSISNDVINSGTTITLDKSSVVKDIVEPDAFNIPEGYNKNSDITVSTEGVTAVEVDGVTTYTRSGDAVVYSDAEVSVDVAANTIEVTNFDYAANFVAPAHEGKMLIIEIRGIEVTNIGFAEAEDDGMVDTNAMFSGIYSEDGILLFPFDKPSVELGNKSYVVDYAKQFEMLVSDWGLASTNYIAKDTTAFEGEQTALDLIYGYVRQIDNAKYTYTPNNMNWADYDTFYAFGKDNDSDLNKWAKVNVIPANNVYYEDTFVSTEGENGAPATVGIEYSGNFEVTSTEGSNSESADTSVHGGWENGDLADDIEFSDGTVAKGTADLENPAKATFTFTGTGVDVYSYTDMTTGAVRAILRDASNNELIKYLVVDNLSETGSYYQIPTLSFNNLPYGTYTLELKVNSVNRTDENNKVRETYYLDGIRIYNPLGNNIEDETVKDAYEDELNAVFTEVRDILIDAGSFGEGQQIGDITVNGALFVEDPEQFGDFSLELNADSVGIFEKSGPENEVYLAPGQAIAFKVDTTAGNKYYVGLKAMEGKETSVKYTAGNSNVEEFPIGHSTDLYYEVVPTSDGYVMIQNSGNAMLSITKIRTTNPEKAVADDWYKTATVGELAEYANTFNQIASVAGEFAAPMLPPAEVIEPENEAAPEIEIEIEIETPAEPEVDTEAEEVAKLIETIFNAFRGWFGR